MNRETSTFTAIHYHIHWISSDSLDWERHDTRVEAEESAIELVREDEGYEIEEFNGICALCRSLGRSEGRP